MDLAAAFLLGFIGSLHCIGMCGPIAVALPAQQPASRVAYLFGRLSYNLGRILTYTVAGGIFGALGQAISLAGFQQALSIGLGSLLLLIVIFKMGRPVPKSRNFTAPPRLLALWQKATAAFFRMRSFTGLFLIGLLNGALPCGLVYAALAGAASTGDAGMGALFGLLFGLGTLPAMLATALAGRALRLPLRHRLKNALPAATALLAVILILRGLSLGIPYLSPVLPETARPVQHLHMRQ